MLDARSRSDPAVIEKIKDDVDRAKRAYQKALDRLSAIQNKLTTVDEG